MHADWQTNMLSTPTSKRLPARSLPLLLLLLLLASPVQQLSSCDQLCNDVHLAPCDVHSIQLDAVGVVHLQQQQQQ
jgi:hypothetical protein